MTSGDLTSEQLALIQQPLDSRIFLEGPAGAGKTTAGVERLLYLMQQGVPAASIMLLVPQRTLAEPYETAMQTPGLVAGGVVSTLTLGGLARRMLELFWPLIAEQAGFSRPNRPPTFLTLETAQYYMAHLVRPLLDQGYFESVAIERNRLYSQILDNLNKAALVGFDHTQIGERLQQAWQGEPSLLRIYQDAQTCANRFREYCLQHSLLDFSLQVEIFLKHLWPAGLCRSYLTQLYRHLIVDNLEEDTPVTHDLLLEWLPQLDSSLLIYDWQAGYRTFLGADPEQAYRLRGACRQVFEFPTSLVMSPAVAGLHTSLEAAIAPASADKKQAAQAPRPGDRAAALHIVSARFYPQMLDEIAGQIASLVEEEGVPPDEIAVLAPFLPDSLRFSLTYRLEQRRIPVRSHRPSRPLRAEPATHCLLNLACLAHPEWGLPIGRFDLAQALLQAIQDLDLVRAQLLVDALFPRQGGSINDWQPFEQVEASVQERFTFLLGRRLERLRLWLAEYSQGAPQHFDHFLSRLFGEILSQPGFTFHQQYTAGEVTANLIESIQKFRWAAGDLLAAEHIPLGKEYVLMVQEGVIAAQYIRSWLAGAPTGLWRSPMGEPGAVLLAPAYTFLLNNRPVDYQFWLGVGSRGWSERLYQPLTHPHVLSRRWTPGRAWTDVEEFETGQQTLLHLALGLVKRCRKAVFLGLSELGEQGYEERGRLLNAFQRVLRQAKGAE